MDKSLLCDFLRKERGGTLSVRLESAQVNNPVGQEAQGLSLVVLR